MEQVEDRPSLLLVGIALLPFIFVLSSLLGLVIEGITLLHTRLFKKHPFRELNEETILDRLRTLRIYRWEAYAVDSLYYFSIDNHVQCFGPVPLTRFYQQLPCISGEESMERFNALFCIDRLFLVCNTILDIDCRKHIITYIYQLLQPHTCYGIYSTNGYSYLCLRKKPHLLINKMTYY